jgi:hypothetical protein
MTPLFYTGEPVAMFSRAWFAIVVSGYKAPAYADADLWRGPGDKNRQGFTDYIYEETADV